MTEHKTYIDWLDLPPAAIKEYELPPVDFKAYGFEAVVMYADGERVVKERYLLERDDYLKEQVRARRGAMAAARYLGRHAKEPEVKERYERYVSQCQEEIAMFECASLIEDHIQHMEEMRAVELQGVAERLEGILGKERLH